MKNEVAKSLFIKLFGKELLDELPYQHCLIVGIRMSLKVNKFDDYIGVLFKDYNTDNTYFRLFPATTTPGKASLLTPMNKLGTAILPSGYYKNLWKEGLHQGKYKALVQNRPVDLFRDNNKNSELNLDKLVKSKNIVGINLHTTNSNYKFTRQIDIIKSYFVEKWSAGCQVIASHKHFNMLMWFISIAKNKTFDYILVDNNERIKHINLDENGVIRQWD